MNKTIKKLFLFFWLVFVLVSIHLWYMYVNYFGESRVIKWWTIIEWTIQKINYLPYTSFTKNDRFYQWLIFDKCAQSSGVDLIDSICSVTTKDFREFTIKLNQKYSSKWSDGSYVTIDDIYFTYNDVIKNNLFQIPDLGVYSNLDIRRSLSDTIKIKFPIASIDNQLFFDNYILPVQSLSGQNLSYYQAEFANKLVTNACATIQKNNIDDNSLIFNLSGCNDLLKQYYQIKKFDTSDILSENMNNPQGIIDFTNEENISFVKTWYNKYSYETSKFLVLFMNTSSINSEIRKNIYKFIKTSNIADFDIYNSQLFATDPNWQKLKQVLAASGSMVTISSGSNTITDLKLPLLTKSIYVYGSNKYKTYQIDKVPDTGFPINFKFDKSYVKVWISANGAGKYTPSTYNSGSRSTDYNISIKFNNLKKWINYYTIRWYTEENPEEPVKLLTIKLHYGTQVITNQVTTSKKDKFKIIYTKNDFINKYISWLQAKFVAEGVDSYFTLEWFDNVSELNGKINNKDYDIVLKMYDFGNKYDLSMFFGDNLIINPSWYKNPTVQQNISDYMLGNKWLKADIQKVYQSELPFIIISRDKWYIYSKYDYDFTWFDGKVDSDNWRKVFVNQYKPTKKPIIDNTIFNLEKLTKFIKDILYWANQQK